MILDTDVNSLETKKLNLELELSDLLKSNNKSEDRINELKSEILYLKKQIAHKLGNKEVKKQEEIRKKKLGIDERNKKNYAAFKAKYKKISKMEIATKRILPVIDKYLKNNNYQDNLIKVMK